MAISLKNICLPSQIEEAWKAGRMMAVLHLQRRQKSSKAIIPSQEALSWIDIKSWKPLLKYVFGIWLLGPGSSTIHLKLAPKGSSHAAWPLWVLWGASALLSSPRHFLIIQKLSDSNLQALLGSHPSSTRALCDGLFEFLGSCAHFSDLVTATLHAIFHSLWIQWHCRWSIRHTRFKGLSKCLEMIRDFELYFFKENISPYMDTLPQRRMDLEPLLSDRSHSRMWNSKSNDRLETHAKVAQAFNRVWRRQCQSFLCPELL